MATTEGTLQDLNNWAQNRTELTLFDIKRRLLHLGARIIQIDHTGTDIPSEIATDAEFALSVFVNDDLRKKIY